MNGFVAAFRVELLKARRSVAPPLTGLAFAIAPLVGGLFMYILADPERARRMGLIGQKAQLAGGGSDWPAYFAFLAQAATVGGFVLFAFVIAWVFGREFSDGTVRYLLALPTSRAAIITAKLVVVALWCAALTALITLLGLVVGAALGLPAMVDRRPLAGSGARLGRRRAHVPDRGAAGAPRRRGPRLPRAARLRDADAHPRAGRSARPAAATGSPGPSPRSTRKSPARPAEGSRRSAS